MTTPAIKAQILTEIAETDDPRLKTILLLMLQVLEEIGGKIDSVLADEQALKSAVLKGYSETHETHHQWIASKIQDERDREAEDKRSRRKIRDGVIERLLWGALVAALAGMQLWPK